MSSDDELGVLNTSFNDMILGLREREALRGEKTKLTAALRTLSQISSAMSGSCALHARGWSLPRTWSVAGWSVTCTTAPSSSSCS